MKLAFITGISGQDGSYLSELLLEKGYKVYGIVRRTSLLYTHTRIDHIRDKLTLKYGDMSDSACLSLFINEIITDNPNFERLEIYNLAAQSHVKVSFDIPEYTADIDGIGCMRLLEIIRNIITKNKVLISKIRFYQAGTSEMFGKVLETPQNENTPFNPVSPYAAAKVYAYYMVKCYREGYGIFAVNGILFNHESARRGENFLTMKVVNAVKKISTKQQEFVELGNLDSKRDWGHAKDYVKGMWLMLQSTTPEDYVLATNETHTVREFVERAFKYCGYDIKWKNEGGIDQDGIVRVKINPKYYRVCEVDLLLGDSSKARDKLKWEREYDSLDKLIVSMFVD